MKRKQIKNSLIRLNPITASILLSLPIISYADVSMQNGKISMVNGVPVVYINGANANGISHNVYDKLNVSKEGMIFNNSQNGANTTLAGQVAGNSNLVSGAAKVILNEVTSRNKSALNGMMEVAGDKAHLIIANPNGITCNGCGFINAEKVTVTTGKPDMQNGELKGYSVNSGIITTNGLKSDSPTAILARSIVVNGEITVSGQELSLIAGNNYVNTSNQVTGSVRASGSRNTYSIDVAVLGGMYANKINLISTESGVGVRNVGVLATGTGGVQIDTKGRLINNNNAQIKSSGMISIKTDGALDNVTGKVMSDMSVYIDTNKNAINNSRAGNIMSGADMYINSGAFNNTNGKVAAVGTLGLNTNNMTLINSGKGKTVGIEAAIVALNTGTLDNRGGQIKGYYVGNQSTSVNNSNGVIDSYGSVDIISTGNVNNNGGLIRAATGHVKIDASGNTVSNGNTKSADAASADSLGIIAGDGGIQIIANTLDNSSGQISSSGDMGFLAASNVNNSNGKLVSGKNIFIKAASLDNSQAGLSAKGGVNIDLLGDFTNRIGIVSSKDGDVNLNARRVNNSGGLIEGQNINISAIGEVNNDTALMVAQKNLIIKTQGNVTNQDSSRFGSSYGLYLGMPNQEGGMIGHGGVDITANRVNNDRSRIVAKNGPLTMVVTGELSNDRSMLVGGKGSSSIKAGSISNNYSTIYSSGDLLIDTRSLSMFSSGNFINNNAKGIVTSDGALTLNIGSNFTNFGWISGKEKVSINVDGSLNNRNTIYSDKEVNVSARSVSNTNVMVGGNQLSVNSVGTIYNSGTMFTEGAASIKGTTVTNTGSSAVLGGRQGLVLNANRISGSGKVIGL